MADDARISTAFPRHPKTVKLFRRLGALGCWHLVCLFLWVAENRPTGNLKGLTDEDVEIAAEWSGESGQFTKTLNDLHFIDGTTGSYVVHDWAEHNPWAASRDKRIAAARAAAAVRWQSGSNADRMRRASAPHKSAMPTTRPHPTQPYPTKKTRSGTVVPCEWISSEAWSGFVEMRNKLRKPLTDRAVSLIVSKLRKFREAGDDPGAVLDQSTRNGWQDVYPIKGTEESNGNTNRAERRKVANIAAGNEALAIIEGRRAN